MAGFPWVARPDAGLLLSQLAAGTVLTWDGACPGGQVGAAYVRWPDGHRSVLTCQPPGGMAAVRRTEGLLAAGWPIRHLTAGHVSTWLAIAEDPRP